MQTAIALVALATCAFVPSSVLVWRVFGVRDWTSLVGLTLVVGLFALPMLVVAVAMVLRTHVTVELTAGVAAVVTCGAYLLPRKSMTTP